MGRGQDLLISICVKIYIKISYTNFKIEKDRAKLHLGPPLNTTTDSAATRNEPHHRRRSRQAKPTRCATTCTTKTTGHKLVALPMPNINKDSNQKKKKTTSALYTRKDGNKKLQHFNFINHNCLQEIWFQTKEIPPICEIRLPLPKGHVDYVLISDHKGDMFVEKWSSPVSIFEFFCVFCLPNILYFFFVVFIVLNFCYFFVQCHPLYLCFCFFFC